MGTQSTWEPAEGPRRTPRWQPESSDQEIEHLLEGIRSNDHSLQEKKHMKGMFRRLKHKGKSDARGREIVAQHLPKGTGPKDLQDVRVFSENDVTASRKKFFDEVTEPVKNIEKQVRDMQATRYELQSSRTRLFRALDMHLLEQKQVMASFGGLDLLGKKEEPPADQGKKSAEKRKSIAAAEKRKSIAEGRKSVA